MLLFPCVSHNMGALYWHKHIPVIRVVDIPCCNGGMTIFWSNFASCRAVKVSLGAQHKRFWTKALAPCLPGHGIQSLFFVLLFSFLLGLTLFECSSFISLPQQGQTDQLPGKLHTCTYQCVCSKCGQSHKSNTRSAAGTVHGTNMYASWSCVFSVHLSF